MNAKHWSVLSNGIAARPPPVPVFTFTLPLLRQTANAASHRRLPAAQSHLTTTQIIIATRHPVSLTFYLNHHTRSITNTTQPSLHHPPITANTNHCHHEAPAEARLRPARDREVCGLHLHLHRLADFYAASNASRSLLRSSAAAAPRTCPMLSTPQSSSPTTGIRSRLKAASSSLSTVTAAPEVRRLSKSNARCATRPRRLKTSQRARRPSLTLP